jgi:hypothetical protein
VQEKHACVALLALQKNFLPRWAAGAAAVEAHPLMGLHAPTWTWEWTDVAGLYCPTYSVNCVLILLVSGIIRRLGSKNNFISEIGII